MFNIGHVAISVSNMNNSVNFYKKFGFVDFKNYKDENLEITMLKLNDMILELFCYNQFDKIPEHSKELSTDLKTIGTKHFALSVDSIEEGKRFIIENNIKENVEILKGRLGKSYFFIKDPDGILVEIIERD